VTTWHKWGDAAFAANLDGTSFAGVGGYYGGPGAFHIWPRADWGRFPGFRLPIWVAGLPPGSGLDDGTAAVAELRKLGVPKGCRTVLDMETSTNAQYVEHFGAVLDSSGYLVEVYGSQSTIGRLPPLNGYWVADYTSNLTLIDQIMTSPHVRSVQYAAGPLYDTSVRKPWTEGEMWHG
jgi:hypothetical protein